MSLASTKVSEIRMQSKQACLSIPPFIWVEVSVKDLLVHILQQYQAQLILL